MNTLWVFLLDSSPSMKSGFSGSRRDSMEPTEYGDYATKLEAAKDRLPREVFARPNSDFVVIEFNDEPHLVMKGSTNESTSIEECARAVNKIEARGRCTNIAAALKFPIEELPNLRTYRKLRILLISDGLSTAGNPISAARACDDFGFTVNVLLIDKTKEGLELAHQIADGGAVSTVDTSRKFEKGLDAFREADSAAPNGALDKVERRLAHQEAKLSAEIEANASRQEQYYRRSLQVFNTWGKAAALGLGILVAYSTAVGQVLTKPGTGFAILVSAVLLIAGCILVWAFFSKTVGIHVSGTERNLPSRFSKRVRIFCLLSGVVCHIAWPSVLYASATRSAEVTKREAPTKVPMLSEEAKVQIAAITRQITDEVKTEISNLLPGVVDKAIDKSEIADEVANEVWSRIEPRLERLLTPMNSGSTTAKE